MKTEYDDYPTCAEAYATLRLYHRELGPEFATAALGIEPTATQGIGEPHESSNRIRTTKLNGWFLSSEDAVSSFDLSRHLSYLLDRLAGKSADIRNLIGEGWRADIACMWDSAYGHGGPNLNPEILRRLADLGIELWFDVYFHGAYELIKREKETFGGR